MNKLGGFQLFTLSGALFLLAGCEKRADVVRTVDWYKEHKVELYEVLKKCNANPGELMFTPNCMNASSAEDALIWGSRKGIKKAPLDFGKDKVPKKE